MLFCRAFAPEACRSVESMETSWTPRRQGDLGEMSAISWLTGAGASVSLPLFSHPDYDVIADRGDRIERVQVKTSGQLNGDRFVVSLFTRGGNRSWNRIVKRMSDARCDVVFVHVADGRRWYIPVGHIKGTTAIVVGGPKYAEFEVDRGAPLPTRDPPAVVVKR
jgi:PD-(D/E)XK endonuclease